MCINNLNLKMLIITQIKLQLNIYTNIAIRTKKKIKNNEMKHSFVYRSIKEIFQTSSKCNILQKKTTQCNMNNQLPQLKTNKYLEQQNPHTMDNHDENQNLDRSLDKHNDENEAVKDSTSIEKHLDKENYIKFNNYDNENGNDDNNNKTYEADYKRNDVQLQTERYTRFLDDFKENPHTTLSNDHDGNSQYEQSLFSSYNLYPLHININNHTSENIDREEVQDILLAERDGEIKDVKESDNNSELRLSFIDDGLVNNASQNELQLNVRQEEQNDDATLTNNETTHTHQPISAYVESTAHVHLNQRHLVKDLEQQINVHNHFDVADNLCAGTMGSLCDMAAFSKLECSFLGDFKDQDYLVKKYYHPLYAHGVCRWPGCELPLDDMSSFVK
ncbi:GATA zinc finger domain-containing protein 14-like [Calliphora vicina]|uniref:GATA zinc finger domain-containing protein 14-like n=1 Tax=Calliphora vicina TaxID=7373 RepID=UPI00325AF1F7